MAFIGLLIINFIIAFLFGIVCLFIISLIGFIVFLILWRLDKNKKWKKIMTIIFLILTILFLIPLVIVKLLINQEKKIEMNYYNNSIIERI